MGEASRAGRAATSRARSSRGASTRARILEAVVSSIDQVGFARTTSQRIARLAGVSVGAVQHHFPAKDDILAAVLATSVRDLGAQFEGVVVTRSTPLAERVDLFVERAWRHYGSAAFRSTAQILANAQSLAPAGGGHAAPIVASARGAATIWNDVFGDIDVSSRNQREIRRFAFAALTGLASARRFHSGEGGLQAQLTLLETALRALFEAATENAASSRAGPSA